jgi:D-amino-acid dehydrogenase
MLVNPAGALHVPPRYWLTVAPWLFRFMTSATPRKMAAASQALAALYRPAIEAYREILADIGALDLMRLNGHLHLYRSEKQLSKDKPDWDTRLRHGITVERLSRGQIEDLEEGIAEAYQVGMFLPDHGMAVDPFKVASAIADALAQRDVRFIPKLVSALATEGRRVIGIEADGFIHRTDHVVLAAGVWSKELLRGIGYHVPLQSQRGYHIDIRGAGVRPSRPIIPADRKVFITPLEDRLRVAGTVELLGLEAPPTEQRARLLLNDLTAVYPQARLDQQDPFWMGHRPCLPDSLPVLGDTRRWGGLWLGFGHGHLGLTGAAVSGDLIAKCIQGQPPDIDLSAFSVDRFG